MPQHSAHSPTPPVELKFVLKLSDFLDIKFTLVHTVWLLVAKKKKEAFYSKTQNICDCHINTAHGYEIVMTMKATCGRF